MILFVSLSKVTLLKEVLMGTWLHLGLHILFPHDVSFFLGRVLVLGLRWHFLNQAMVIRLTLILILQDVLLLQNTFHHFTRDGLVLLVVVCGPWII
jgi:hypothetical protein